MAWLLAGVPLRAAEAAAAPSAVERAISWTLSLDPFALAVLFLFAATVTGVVIKGRTRDRCLRAFAGYPVEVRLDDGARRGLFRLGNAGFELLPGEPEETPLGRRLSFILYKNEYGRLKWLLCDPAVLGAEDARRRRRRLEVLTDPGPFRRFFRWLSNLAGSFKDAFNDFVNLLVGRFRPQAVARLARGREKYAGRMRQEVVALFPNSSYDAVLETLRGRPVEVEAKVEGLPPALRGVLEEYTSAYLSLVEVLVPGEPAGEVEVRRGEGKVTVVNGTGEPVFLPGDGWRLLPAGGRAELPADAAPEPRRARRVDLLLPRSLAVVRYRLEGF